jgi:hypothetical protein
VTLELTDTTETMLREIADPAMKRRDIAQTYHLALRSSHPTDWPRVNAAIMERWGRSALIWIKTQAWNGRCFRDKLRKETQCTNGPLSASEGEGDR